MNSKRLKKIVAKAVVSAFFAVWLSMLSGCPPPSPSRFRAGYADFWVEFIDYVIDRSGRVTEAYCANLVTFYGDIDWDCARAPMVWSYDEYNWMTCSYVDYYGSLWSYEDRFYFYSGYIQEEPCYTGYDYPDVYGQDVYAVSTLDRNKDDQFELSEHIEIDEEVTFALSELRDRFRNDESFRSELRERVHSFLEENGEPLGLTDEAGTTRVTDSQEGNAPADYGTVR
jgi:hypothetical protein